VEFEDLVRGQMSFDGRKIGDFVILRSESIAPYNFAVVVDDALMEITHVIRGEDHLANTARQLLLYQALGFTPPRFAHLSMILGARSDPPEQASRGDGRVPLPGRRNTCPRDWSTTWPSWGGLRRMGRRSSPWRNW